MRGRFSVRAAVTLASVALLATLGASSQAGAADELDRYIVQLTDRPLASYRGGILGLEATNPAARGEVKLDTTSAASKAYLSYLAQKHADFLSAVSQALARPVAAEYDYRYAFNGVAIRLSESEAATVASMAGVKNVERETHLELLTDAGPAWIGAPSVWSGGGGGAATKGEGLVAGIIDTGVNTDHPSFADVGGDGYNHSNPRGRFYGACDPIVGLPFCNDKLIGVYDFTGTTPEDHNQHGSHTASTVAGNVGKATLFAPTMTTTRDISGVAPHANLITYKVCITSCPNASIVMAIDQATADAVDVINFSIGGGSRDPWTDSSALAFLGARDAGVFVAASAGNSGPGAQTIGSPSNSPWVTSVGASTHNRKLANALVSMSGGATTPPANLEGKSFTTGYGPARIVDAKAYGDELCGAPFAPGTFNGEIVVCLRGINPRVEKGRNVEVGGAGGMVLVNSQADGESTVGDPHELPAVHLGYTDGKTLRTWLSDGGSGHTATIAGTTFDMANENGDIMAGFSSRGPDKSVPSVLKPDVTAPGVDVLAAVQTLGNTTSPVGSAEYGILSGTSMSGPHTAGAAVLVRSLHPNWTPAEVQSALMTTGVTAGLRKEDGLRTADPFDIGAGRVNLASAGKAGLVLNETLANYEAANPAAGGDPTALNTASLSSPDCAGVCSWTRTVRSTLGSSATWTAKISAPRGTTFTVSPSRFTLAPGATQTLAVEANVSNAPVGKWVFAELGLSARGATDQHLPIAVLPGGSPQPVNIATASSTGSHAVTYTSKIEIKELTTRVFGLTQGTVTKMRLAQDPTPIEQNGAGGPYDGLGGTKTILVDVPAGSKYLTADIARTTSTDIDLYVGRDDDGDGRAERTEQRCASASEAALESCQLKNPEGGKYWILVQNWLLGQAPADDVELVASVVPGTDNGNLSVTGPKSAAAGQPFNLTLTWNEPAMHAGSTWFALVDLGSDRKHPGNAGSLLVRINRTS